jgi:hypothetical protein
MTVDLYGHLVDANLWQAARLVGDISGTFEPPGQSDEADDKGETDESTW